MESEKLCARSRTASLRTYIAIEHVNGRVDAVRHQQHLDVRAHFRRYRRNDVDEAALGRNRSYKPKAEAAKCERASRISRLNDHRQFGIVAHVATMRLLKTMRTLRRPILFAHSLFCLATTEMRTARQSSNLCRRV